ncbi:MAG: hypothetical protein IT208_10825 [Chthonomonadales bacterium]|nr:hypothetical protein [Chthonomonadales bacterium]
MRSQRRARGLACALAAAACLLSGCSRKDPLEDAAPPPSANAPRTPPITVRKNLPGPAARTTMGGGPAARPGAGR